MMILPLVDLVLLRGGRALCGILAAVAIGLAPVHAAQPVKPHQITSPDQVPEGLAKSDWSSIRATYEAGRHAFQPVAGQPGVMQARNPGQQWLTTFDQRGFLARPQDGGWEWGLELQSYGIGDAQKAVHGTPAVKADGQRLSYQWDATVQEWFVNDARGLEHGFTVKKRPVEIRDPRSAIRDPQFSHLRARHARDVEAGGRRGRFGRGLPRRGRGHGAELRRPEGLGCRWDRARLAL